MANKRNLKRQINCVCGDLFAECVASSIYNAKENDDNVKNLLASILIIHNNYISRVSHPEPGMTAAAYYRDLQKCFNSEVTEIGDQIINLG